MFTFVRHQGDVDRLRRFWLTGVCKPYKEERQFSEPLATEQFLSAFLLLLSGIGLAVLLLGLEHVYFRYIRSYLAKTTTGGCCSLISIVSPSNSACLHALFKLSFTSSKSLLDLTVQNMGKSLTFRDAVFETQDRLRSHRCRDAICRLHLRRMMLQLDCARSRIRHLEKLLNNQYIG